MKFEDIGKLIDSLELDKKIDQVGRILERVAFPATEVKEPEVKFDKNKIDQFWMACTPKDTMHMNCVYITKANLFLIGEYLKGLGYVIEHKHNGLEARHHYQRAEITYGKWVIVNNDKIQAVLADADFKEKYKVTDFNW